MITLRSATTEDLPVLLEFEQGVVKAERPYNPTLINGEIHYYDLNFLINSSDAYLIIAEGDNKAIACGYALIRNAEKNYVKFSRYAYLGFMYVDPEYRGRGINRLILDDLIAWAKGKEISEVRLDVYSENKSAVRAYEKTGFESLITMMRKEI